MCAPLTASSSQSARRLSRRVQSTSRYNTNQSAPIDKHQAKPLTVVLFTHFSFFRGVLRTSASSRRVSRGMYVTGKDRLERTEPRTGRQSANIIQSCGTLTRRLLVANLVGAYIRGGGSSKCICFVVFLGVLFFFSAEIYRRHLNDKDANSETSSPHFADIKTQRYS